MSRGYRAIPPNQLAGDAAIPYIGVTAKFRGCVLKYLPDGLDQRRRDGYLRLLGLLLVWLRPDQESGDRFRIYRKQVAACLGETERAEKHKRSFSAKVELSDLQCATGIDLAMEPEVIPQKRSSGCSITVDPRWPEALVQARRELLYGTSVPSRDLVDLVTGEAWPSQYNLLAMNRTAKQATDEAEGAYREGSIPQETLELLRYMNARDPELFRLLVCPNIPSARQLAGTLLDVGQRDQALRSARDLVRQIPSGAARERLECALQGVSDTLMSPPGVRTPHQRQLALNEFRSALQSPERVASAVAGLRGLLDKLPQKARNSIDARLKTIETAEIGSKEYREVCYRIRGGFRDVPQATDALACLGYPAVAPLCPIAAFEVQRSLRSAFGNVTKYEQTCQALFVIEQQPKPIYWHSTNTPRISPRGQNLTHVPRVIRRALFPYGLEVDMRNAHLAINAALWGVESVLEVLRGGTSIWRVLERDIGMTADQKDAFKTALYALLYLSSLRRVREDLWSEGIPIQMIDAFLDHRLTKDLREARGKAAKAADDSIAGVGVQACPTVSDGLGEDVPPAQCCRPDTRVPSIMAVQAQGIEVKLMAGILAGCQETSEATYEVLLWQHDGCTLIAAEAIDELRQGYSGGQENLSGAIVHIMPYRRAQIRAAIRLEQHWERLERNKVIPSVPTALEASWSPNFIDDGDLESLTLKIGRELIRRHGEVVPISTIREFVASAPVLKGMQHREVVWLLRQAGATETRRGNQRCLNLSRMATDDPDASMLGSAVSSTSLGDFESIPVLAGTGSDELTGEDGVTRHTHWSLKVAEEILPEDWGPSVESSEDEETEDSSKDEGPPPSEISSSAR